ncbi:hypothetical protein JTE90_009593 [Oedothorax gibbosus]|uniref:Amidase domain-containing protein n=1 Tax=Oedothorax gibbosus TaxID=931172 RepID=A0AAV6VHZ0_9ARAC|nr:hypothetical protein JTE90_009593 [Oedothorax gibbosus]
MQRILEVEPYINATVERPFAEALAEAKEADALVASGNYTREQLALDKPLLGVPFSVKGLLKVKNLQCTSGSLLFKDHIATEDSTSVELMKKAGAIVIATTNCPEFGMDLETNNRVHGKTCNPYGVNRTPGGSSGGESALVGAAGSVIGIGNDLIGSIRVPCHFTGIYGHKPTMGLVSNGGVVPNPHPGMEMFISTGPMCRYAEDLIASMKVLSTHEETRLKFGKSVNFKKIKICYMTQIQSPLVAPVDSEILGGLKKAISYFETTYDVTSKEINVPLLYDTNRCVCSHISSPEDLKETEDLKEVMTQGKASHINVKTDLLKYLVGKSTFTRGPLVVMNFVRSSPLFNKNKTEFYKQMLNKLAKEFDHLLDEDTVLLMPTLPTSAPYHTEMMAYIPSTCYTSIFNILGLPSTQCPLGINRDGLPFGIQIVGRKYNDPLTIACAIEIRKEFGGWVQPGSY